MENIAMELEQRWFYYFLMDVVSSHRRMLYCYRVFIATVVGKR